MFWDWFKRSTVGVYRPKERLIYRYFDGEKIVRADPMILWKKVMDLSKDLEIDIQVATSKLVKPQDADVAEAKALAKVRDIFGVKPLAEGGLTETEQAELLDSFMNYCQALKKNSNHSATFSNNREYQSPFAKSPTPPPSVSGSTASAASTATPAPSPKAAG